MNKIRGKKDKWNIILNPKNIDLSSEEKVNHAITVISKIANLKEAKINAIIKKCKLNKQAVITSSHLERAELYEEQFKDCGIIVSISKI